MNFEPAIECRRLYVRCVFPVAHIEFLLSDVEERRGVGPGQLEDALDQLIKAKLPKDALLRETLVYGDICFVIEYDVPATRVAYMEKRILIAVRRACKAFWGIHKIGKTPEFKAQWRKENPI